MREHPRCSAAEKLEAQSITKSSLLPSRTQLESPAWAAQNSRRQKDDGLHQFEHAPHRDAENAEGQEQQPNQRIENDRHNRQRPAENQQNAPQQEAKHNASAL